MGILVNNKNTPSPAKLEEAIRLFSTGEKNIKNQMSDKEFYVWL
jgi:hypothetical protein